MTEEKSEIKLGCLIEFDPGDQIIKKGKPTNKLFVGLVTALEGDILQVLYFQDERRQYFQHNFSHRNTNYRVLTKSIKSLDFLKSFGPNISEIIKKHELVDPKEVYPINKRIDYNGLNEGTIDYTKDELIVSTIRCHISLAYYETIFNDIINNEIEILEKRDDEKTLEQKEFEKMMLEEPDDLSPVWVDGNTVTFHNNSTVTLDTASADTSVRDSSNISKFSLYSGITSKLNERANA